MYLPALTDSEFIHYLDVNCSDPVIARLLEIAAGKNTILQDLERLGMRDGEFETENDGYMPPAEYIEHLRRRIDHLTYDLDSAEDECRRAQSELDRLRGRTLIQVLTDYDKRIQDLEYTVVAQTRATKQAEQRADELQHKLETWRIIGT